MHPDVRLTRMCAPLASHARSSYEEEPSALMYEEA